VPDDEIARTLRRIASTLPGGGEDRPGQVEMARAVGAAIASERHLVVQAGTGTGKSLAYLVPAVLSGQRVVVATATKALQDQLAEKDLPAIARGVGRPVAFAVLKGRQNYLCRQRAAEIGGHGVQQTLDSAPNGRDGDPTVEPADGTAGDPGVELAVEPGSLAHQVHRLLRWAETSTTGDRGDLDFEPHPKAWAMLSVGARECPGAHRCPEGARCFAERARQRAAEADVVVVNAHLYGAHLASEGAVLPPHDVVVFDEAHELEAVMTESLGVEVAPGRLSALQALAQPFLTADGEALPVDLAGPADRLRALLAPRVGTRVLTRAAGDADPAAAPEGRERPLFSPPVGARPDDADLGALLELVATRVERTRDLLLGANRDGEPHAADDGARSARLSRALAAAGHLVEDLRRFAAPSPDEVAWVDGTARLPVLRLSPVDVGPPLASALWGSVTAVLTSATIPPMATERLGLDGFDVDQVDAGSPFDFRSHALLYVARHLPDRRRADAEPALHEELAALIDAAGGRTLALFTSRRATQAAAEALRDRLPYAVLVQGDLPKGRLLDVFATEETSCLFATLGFWQGVDVPGRALSLVTLDRLPFGRPDDPLLEARRERAGGDAFRLVDLPRAATLLAQGVGRLIRSAADTGVVAVLDPRLATAGYRRTLLDALPPMRRTVDRQEVADFLASALGPPRR
jgi:ATP-dependent DNA helicase DinG